MPFSNEFGPEIGAINFDYSVHLSLQEIKRDLFFLGKLVQDIQNEKEREALLTYVLKHVQEAFGSKDEFGDLS